MSSDCRAGADDTRSRERADLDRTTARYLLAVSMLSAESEGRVTTGQLREHLDVAPASATEMVGKLDERGLVDYEKYEGVRLSDRGGRLVSPVARRLCVVTSFFDAELDTTLDERTAFDIGFALPEEGVDRLRERTATGCLELCPESDGHERGCHA